MNTLFMRILRSPCVVFLFAALIILSNRALAELNPNFIYLYKGELVGERSFSLGDPTNWTSQVVGRSGKSAGGKVSLAPTDFKGAGDAIQITWAPRKKVSGNIGIYGTPLDLSAFRDAVALTLDMRVDVKPDSDVKVGLDCGYPCRGDLSIRRLIRSMPVGEWFSLPLPLNCFKGDTFDLSKINGPFTLSTEGKLTVSITNIRLEKLEEGEKGCVEEKPKG